MSRPNQWGVSARSALIRLALALVLLIQAGGAAAHLLQVFAAADGAWIRGHVEFAGGRPAPGMEVLIMGTDGKVKATLQTDANGAFSYRPKAPQDLLVVAKSADGHRAQWPIRASELQGAFDAATDGGSDDAHMPGLRALSSATAHSHPHPHGDEGIDATVVARHGAEPAQLDAEVFAAIEQAVARQVRPLRESLAEAQARAGLRDVLGGVGYIVGLAGLGLWWTSRRDRLRRDAQGDR
jgi:nickel transport protein